MVCRNINGMAAKPRSMRTNSIRGLPTARKTNWTDECLRNTWLRSRLMPTPKQNGKPSVAVIVINGMIGFQRLFRAP